uniref:Putative transforming growth factor-beta-induced protein ig-h3-like isoform x3 n=1 Tax=Panstrongylus lignarius TaxID=156445 RepID=A0A224X7Z1_9HEMI
MSGQKLSFFLLVSFLAAATTAQWIDSPADLFSSFHKSLSDLASKGVEDMLADEAAEVGVKDKSREELEKVDDDNKDESASQESTEDDDKSSVNPLLTSTDDFFSLFPNIFRVLQSPALKPWWQGDNVCKETEEKEEKGEDAHPFLIGKAHFSSCKYMPNKYECITEVRERGKPTKKTIVTYRCCHGYKVKPGTQSCQAAETKPIDELAKELGAGKFLDMVKQEDMLEAIKGAKTVFMPKDEAMDEFLNKEAEATNEIERSALDKKAIILNHIIPEIKETSDMQDNMVLKAEDGFGLRLSSYPGGMVTVNCIPINETDKETEDGVVHTVEGVLTPIKHDITEILSQEKFSKFRELLKEHNLWDTLNGESAFTVFAVNNEGVDKLDPSSSMCLATILRHHIVPITVCSKAAPASGKKISMADLGSSWLHMSNKDDQLMLDDKAVVITRDIVAKNGVVHEVDQFVVPTSGQPASELMRRTKHTRFLDLLEKAGLKSEVDKRKDVTVFIPLENSLDELEGLEPEKLKEALLLHIVPHKLTSYDLRNNSTLDTALNDAKLTVSASKNILSSLIGSQSPMTIQCIPLTRVDGRVCNGYAHEIERPVQIATGTILDMIQNDESLATFREILQGTKLEEQLKVGLPKHITLLAPTDVAFKDLSEEKLEKLKTDKEFADKVLRDHVINDTLCCSGVGASSWPFISTVRTSSGKELETDRSRGRIMFGRFSVTSCDKITKDGIVHKIDGVLLPPERHPQREIIFKRPNSEIILAGFK